MYICPNTTSAQMKLVIGVPRMYQGYSFLVKHLNHSSCVEGNAFPQDFQAAGIGFGMRLDNVFKRDNCPPKRPKFSVRESGSWLIVNSATKELMRCSMPYQ
jgi:hypothetical protein